MDTVALVGRLLVSLAFVLGLMWLLARRVKSPGKGKNSRLVDVLGRQQLSRTSSVAIVRVMDQALILGVTDSTVTVIGETDLESVQARLDAGAAAATARPARAARTARPSSRPGSRPTARPAVAVDAAAGSEPTGAEPTGPRKALAGSALSPDTWRQTLDTLREMTVRTK